MFTRGWLAALASRYVPRKRPWRYLDEKEPTLKNFAEVVRKLEQRQVDG